MSLPVDAGTNNNQNKNQVVIYMRAQDEPSKPIPERTDRVFSSEERWYFKTREAEQVGPFRYQSEAQSGLERFLEQLKHRVE